MKIIVALMLVVILASLFSALYFMMRPGANRESMVRALALRVGLSVLLFVSLLLARHFGLIEAGGFRL